jgi:predicted phage-related endonuclease
MVTATIQSTNLTPFQLQRRRKYITASEAPAVCGVSPWATAYDVYLGKTMKLEEASSDAMDAGHYAEMAVLAFAQDKLREICDNPQLRLTRANQFRVHHNGVMSCTLDARVAGEPVIVQAKTTGLVHPNADLSEWGDELTDEIPDHIIVQVQAEMACLGPEYQVAWVPVWLSCKGFRLYKVSRNEDLIQHIEQQCVAFYQDHVEPQVPPDAEPGLDTVKRISRTDRGMAVAVPDELFVQYHEKNEAAKDLVKQADAAKAQLLAYLGDARHGVSPAGHRIKLTPIAARHMNYERKAYDRPYITVRQAALVGC